MATAEPPRAAVVGLVHESNTFTVQYLGETPVSAFTCHEGGDIEDALGGTDTVVGGYLAACRDDGVTVRPAFHARAEPGPSLATEAFSELEGRLATALQAAGPVGVVLLDLHGAGVVAPSRSVDLAVVRRVRELLPRAVVAVTMDLHANVPPPLVELVDIVVGYHQYPHVDAASRARHAANLAFETARRSVRPVAVQRRLRMLLPPSPTTDGSAAAELRGLLELIERRPDVLACTAFHGFPYADTTQAATTVVTVTDGDPALAKASCEEVAGWIESQRWRFLPACMTPEEAVRAALAQPGPAVIGDGTDNPGSGAVGDSTYLLHELLAVREPTCLAALWDPESVAAAAAAGPGEQVTLSLGGRHGWASGPPVETTATVRAVSDGNIVQTAMGRGRHVHFGRCARLTVGHTDLIIAGQRRQVFDPEILYLHGVLPHRYRISAVKSLGHFRAGFADVSQSLLVADAPGPTSRRIDDIPRSGPTRKLWPMVR